jgi:hypothetical protein
MVLKEAKMRQIVVATFASSDGVTRIAAPRSLSDRVIVANCKPDSMPKDIYRRG